MRRWRFEPDLPVKVVTLWALLAVLVCAVPVLLLERLRETQAHLQVGQVAGLAGTTEALLGSRLNTLAVLLQGAQAEASPRTYDDAMDGLVRGVLVLDPGEEARLLAEPTPVMTARPLLMGRPHMGADNEWILPVMRPGQGNGERPVLAALDPRRLLPSPAMTGFGAVLTTPEGQVLAAAGASQALLGQRVALPTRAEGQADGRTYAWRRLDSDGLVLMASLPAGGGVTRGVSLALALAALLALAAAGVAARRGWLRQCARLREAELRAEAGQRQVAEIVNALEQGACLLDAELRLVAWNPPFAELAGVAPTALRPGLAAEELQRQGDSPEGAIRAALRHRISDMQDRRHGCATRFRPDGSRVQDRWTTLEDGGILLTCRLASEEPAVPVRPAPPRPASAHTLARLCADELRKRLPLLQEAVERGDGPSARVEAHAMKGVAANFGLPELAASLEGLEQATRADDLPRLRSATQMLPKQLDAALDTLFSRVA